MSDVILSERNPLVPLDHARIPTPRIKLGIVVGGSLNEGLLVKLDRDTYIEGLTVGSYVTIDGQTDRKFIGLITDIRLAATDENIQKMPPELDEFITRIYRGITVFGVLNVKPMLVLEHSNSEPKPVKTVPTHFTIAYHSTPEEVQAIFAAEEKQSYRIGASVDDANIKISLDLQRFIERSSAIFGRSGTGKTFMALPLVANIIKSDIASVLIFDMHNDYGYRLKGDQGRFYKGLKDLTRISSHIEIVTLDEQSSHRRETSYEFAFSIGYDQIEPEDLEMLRDLLGLSEVQVNAFFALEHRFPKNWVERLMSNTIDEDIQAMIEESQLTAGTYGAMQRKLKRLLSFGFIKPAVAEHFTQRIVDSLSRGNSIVVEFGRYGDDTAAYVFVSNFLTRRIHRRYVEMKETAEASSAKGDAAELRKLVIAVEEAHKFLDPAVAGLTIFGTIAREMRKYNVTLLIIDQRPSQIDSEVMSQIGTRITCALSDEKDIAAVFTGMSGAQQLRSVLASLDSKQQALVMGHAVPMPVVISTREYGPDVYAEFSTAVITPSEQHARNMAKLGRSDDEGLV